MHRVTVGDYDKRVKNPVWHALKWPDISHMKIAKQLEKKKQRKIAGEIYQNDTDEEDNKEQEKQYQLRLAQRLRDEAKTLRETADDAEIDYSYQWVNKKIQKPD